MDKAYKGNDVSEGYTQVSGEWWRKVAIKEEVVKCMLGCSEVYERLGWGNCTFLPDEVSDEVRKAL